MNSVSTIVLPGLDGSTQLLGRFCEAAPQGFSVTLVDLPIDLYDYLALVESFRANFEQRSDCVLVAESFSGPLAVLLAARYPQVITKLILVASFVTRPLPRVAQFLPWSVILRLPLPSFFARQFMLGDTYDAEQMSELKRAVKSVSPQVLAGRLRQLERLDLCDTLRQLECPMMYLRARHDRLIPRRCVEAIRKVRPDVVIAEMDGPHLLLETQPIEAWRHIAEFIG